MYRIPKDARVICLYGTFRVAPN